MRTFAWESALTLGLGDSVKAQWLQGLQTQMELEREGIEEDLKQRLADCTTANAIMRAELAVGKQRLGKLNDQLTLASTEAADFSKQMTVKEGAADEAERQATNVREAIIAGYTTSRRILALRPPTNQELLLSARLSFRSTQESFDDSVQELDHEVERLVTGAKKVFVNYFAGPRAEGSDASDAQTQDTEFQLMGKMLEATGELRKRELAYAAAMHLTKDQYSEPTDQSMGAETFRMMSKVLGAIVPLDKDTDDEADEGGALASFRMADTSDQGKQVRVVDEDAPQFASLQYGFEDEVPQVSEESKDLLNNFLNMF